MENRNQSKEEAAPASVETVRRETNPSLGFAILLALALLVGMGYLWQTYDSGDNVPQWMKALGQFHPIVVQVPIAIIGVVFLMELLGLCGALRHLKQSTRFLLWIAGLAAALALVLGYMLKVSGGWVGDAAIMQVYVWAVAAVTAGALASLMLRSTGGGFLYGLVLTATLCAVFVTAQLGGSLAYGSSYLTKNMPDDWKVKKWLEVENFALGLNKSTTTGQGEEKKAGEEVAAISEEEQEVEEVQEDKAAKAAEAAETTESAAVADVPEAPEAEAKAAAMKTDEAVGPEAKEAKKSGVDSQPEQANDESKGEEKGVEESQAPGSSGAETLYAQTIAPILEAKCVACHGEEKTKGRLRLDDYALAMESAGVIVPGDVGGSELIARIELPLEDGDVMPPEDEPPLTEDEKAILTWWVANDGTADLKMADAELPDEIKEAILRLPESGAIVKQAEEVPGDEPSAIDEAAAAAAAAEVVKLNEAGYAVRAISQEDTALEFNAVNVADEFGDDALAMFVPLGGQVAELNLARTMVTDEGAKSLAKLTGLKKLHLEGTAITDAGLAQLTGLESLEWLNVYGTSVTDEGMKDLEGLPSLKKVFVWQTGVTAAGAEQLEAAIPGIYVERGWDESEVPLDPAPVPQDAPAEKAAEAKKPVANKAKPAAEKVGGDKAEAAKPGAKSVAGPGKKSTNKAAPNPKGESPAPAKAAAANEEKAKEATIEALPKKPEEKEKPASKPKPSTPAETEKKKAA
ncbi:MAG: c-type cytochrome domain-containing protein [Verrucomicrobiota bacterium]